MSSTVRQTEMTTMFAQGMISVSYASKLLGCHWTTLYRWVDSGKVQGEAVNRWRRYIVVRSLADFVGSSVAEQTGLNAIMADTTGDALQAMLVAMAPAPKEA